MRIITTLFLCCGLIIVSCKKKNDTPALPPDPNSGRLKAVKIQTDTREYEVTLYDYDTQGRVTRSRSYSVDSTVTPARIDSGTTVSYFYSNSNRPTGYRYYDAGSFFYAGTLTFNTNGQLLKDSSNTSPNGYVSQLKYVPTITIATTNVNPTGGFPPFIQIDSLYFNGSNITRFVSTQTPGVSEQATNYTYSSVQSPVHDLNINYGIPYTWMGFSSRNLPASESFYSGNTLDYTATYSHITAANGKVTRSTVTVSGISVLIFWEYY